VEINSMDKLIDRIAALTSDIEPNVRKANLQLASALFQRIDESTMSPFWPLVLTHLRCTMTALSASIRYSVLPFLRLCVDNFPNLAGKSLPSILPSLVALISTKSSATSTSTKNVTVGGPQLSTEVLSGQKERLRVMGLIGQCLSLKNQKEEDEGIAVWSRNLGTKENSSYNKNTLLYPMGYSDCTKTLVSEELEEDEELNSKFWAEFGSDAIRLVTGTWVEIGPSIEGKKKKDGRNSTGEGQGNKRVRGYGFGFKGTVNDEVQHIGGEIRRFLNSVQIFKS
jgi:hypothetical protein